MYAESADARKMSKISATGELFVVVGMLREVGSMKARVQALLRKNDSPFFAFYCVFFSFATYFSAYAFRKPFTPKGFCRFGEL